MPLMIIFLLIVMGNYVYGMQQPDSDAACSSDDNLILRLQQMIDKKDVPRLTKAVENIMPRLRESQRTTYVGTHNNLHVDFSLAGLQVTVHADLLESHHTKKESFSLKISKFQELLKKMNYKLASIDS